MMKRFTAVCLAAVMTLPAAVWADEAESQTEEMTEEMVSEAEEETEAEELYDFSGTTEIALAETVTVEDVCEFSVESVQVTNDVLPPKAEDYYTHYEAQSGRAYVDICIPYKNLETSDVEADETMSGTLVYCERYQYNGFSIIEEDNRSDFTYSNITSISPLTTEYMHYLFEIPEEVQSSDGQLAAVLVIHETPYKIMVREGETEDVSSPNPDAKEQTEGEVAAGEWIAVDKKGEFSVDYANITNDVMPLQPADYYTHYEADEGKAYVDFCVAYKNLEKTEVEADEVMSAAMTYSGKYEYEGSSIIEEDNRSDFTYSNITYIAPLMTEYVHYLFEVPAEVVESDASIEISFTIGENTYSYTAREGGEAEHGASSDASARTEGEVKDAELIAIGDLCEFSVDYSKIASRIDPPQPADYYSYYEADEGKTYVDFCIAFKNLMEGSVGADEVMNATLLYAGKYEYQGFSMIEEDSRGDFTYSNITDIAPLTTEYVHYLFEVPSEVETSSESVEISFTIGGNTYSYTVR